MKYDRDLKRSRWLASGLFAANLGAAVLNAFTGRWWLVGVGVNAAVSCALLLRLYNSEQRTRDLTRALEDMMAALMAHDASERYRRWG